MDTKTSNNLSLKNFTYLPPFAAYLLSKKLDDFVKKQIEFGFELDIPILRFFWNMPEEQRFEIGKKRTTEILHFLAANKAAEQIEYSLTQWKNDQLPVINRDAIVAEDITLVNYMRKKTMLHFISGYTVDPHEILELIKEIDFYIIQSITVATNQYISLYKHRLEENLHFTQKVAETIPGAVYVFDIENYKGIYSNNKLPDVIGYNHDELNALGENAIAQLVHPDDQAVLQQQLAQVKALADDVPLVFKYRIKKADGSYKWLANYESVFKRKEDGTVWQTIGITLDIDKEQKAVDALHQREQQLVDAQNIAQLGNWSWNVSTRTLEWSSQLYRMYGLEPQSETITIERALSFVHPNDREYVERGMDIRNLEAMPDYTFRIILADGTEKWLRSIAQVLRNETGEISHVIGTEQDVTEKQNLIGKFEESQRLYKQAQKLARLGNFTWNIKTGQLFWSDEVYHIYEKNVGDEILFEDAFKPIIDEHKDVTQKAIEETIARKKGRAVSYAIHKKDGGLKYINLHTDVALNKDGEVAYIIGTAQDVTEHQQAIETIREQEHFIQQIADASPTILYLFDIPSQSIAYINREAYFVLGYLPDEIVAKGSHVTNLFYHVDDVDLLPCRNQSKRTFQQVDSMIQYECRMKNKNGDYRWVLVREIVFKTNDKGAVTQLIGAALDITLRKEMEKTILQNAHQLAQSNASLEEFAYVASHDLKEPLRKISTFGDRLVASQIDKLNEEGKIYLRKIVDASQRMQNMISDLLSISMISGNNAFECTSLQKILEDVLQTLEFKIEQKKAIIHHNELPEANVVPSQLRQLFQNLIANSLKFVRGDEVPVISVQYNIATAEEVKKLGLAKASSYFKICFSDNGIGFDNDYAQKIFAIFQRLHGRSEYEGSGIGLAICKKIVEHHGGAIFAQGELNQGATFTVILPA